MSLYIPGLNLPLSNQELWIAIQSDGSLRYNSCGWHDSQQKAIAVQSHGRTIDVDALWVEINKICDRRDAGIITDLTCIQQILSAVRHAPTVIPAEPCNNLSKPCKKEGE